MKKIGLYLFAFFVLAGCENKPYELYKLDPVATAHAPFEVGAEIFKYKDEWILKFFRC